MTWLVVRFKEDDTVEAIPKKWFLLKESACYWPPQNYDTTAIKAAIKNEYSPDSNWMKYGAIILGTYGDLKLAKRKAIKAQRTDDLSSHTEILTKKNNKIHKRGQGKSKGHKDYSDTDKSYESISDEDSNTYPTLPLSGKRHDNDRSPMESQNITNRKYF
ncbi:uncharacterized protein LOC114930785 [Nylanderia fulva]|uniref:uncharacterized protein LOC114930501 n=1 Tax=Nylanderia fulva TaxID=613905 RepID=UPI0010FB4F71|nr:uncharacterized protein LOC114930501 [Nylanderia fulva]XP_029158456.1 uncharacterized protein LOC114930785 [Nylanderia fulva]